jgi:hypothetical protein
MPSGGSWEHTWPATQTATSGEGRALMQPPDMLAGSPVGCILRLYGCTFCCTVLGCQWWVLDWVLSMT